MPACDRCGAFAPLQPFRSRSWCRACFDRRTTELGEALTTGVLLRESWDLFKAAILPVLVVVVVLAAPLAAIEAFITITFRMQRLWDSTVGLVSYSVVVWAAVTVAMGREITGPQALGASLRRFGGVLLATIVSGFMILIYCLALIVPGVMKALSLKLIVPVALFEPERNALERSEQLMLGHRTTVFWTVCALYGLLFLFMLCLGFGLALAAEFAGMNLDEPSLFDSAISLIAGVFGMVPAGLDAALYLRLTDAEELADADWSEPPPAAVPDAPPEPPPAAVPDAPPEPPAS